MSKNIILNKKEIDIILQRLACQLIENHQDFSNTILIGLQPRGKFLLNRLVEILSTTYNIFKLGSIIGDTVTRFTNIPNSTTSTETGMGVNTSNVQIKAGPTQAGYSPTQLYIRVA